MTNEHVSNGVWRKPRTKLYDCNEDFGSNYYQPMIEYIHLKDIQGPFHERTEVRMPDRAEILSDKYSNMRYNDKTSTDMELEKFLVDSYKKQIKEINSSTASVHRLMIHNSDEQTPFSKFALHGGHMKANNTRNYYRSLLHGINELDVQRRYEADYNSRLQAARNEAIREKYCPIANAMKLKEAERQSMYDDELASRARASIYWIYRPRNVAEFKQWHE